MSELPKRLPEDIARLLAICIRDLLWYKSSVIAFLKGAGVPKAITLDVERRKDLPTLKLIPEVLEHLYSRGDEGFRIARAMLTKIYYWKDVHSVPSDRKDNAIRSLKALQQAYKTYVSQEMYEREVKAQVDRAQRLGVKELDHTLLQEFRDRFDRIYFCEPRLRGNQYEELLNDVFSYYFSDAFQGFNRTGEQLDGQFYFDGHWYYVEVRWRDAPASAADVSVLRDRASKGFAGDVRAVFVSYNGFSDECLASLEASQERVVLLTGYDFRSVLESEIALDVMLHRIQAYLVKHKKTYIAAREIIDMP